MKRSYFQDFVCIDNKYYLHINFMNMSFLLLDEMAHDLYATEDNMDLMKNKNGATDKPCGEGVRTLIQNCC